ncbi:amino acid adenylation domain-containing protein [Colletotrichum scovillei]|uniref:Amino acid adenylation domain-containing protein n=1 Tax=Colletotrichum scovillei TaxID=1209932 RepID=A0A9P7UJQ6_9PEZI|nr:amino acid adenylation domain-containing protein [Colletotrichum scovillei]KAF4782750.1 amino acid adenylation domain-containing protein [Colletotrichum scovillei]KAG7052010.1 amino acid adenylation domain-containing protein [Colletotrichum scovillei]KAG7071045.1 amino acid adenylation domain-containing protein [Colletotrichum scovillei]KAG7079355.1 amino acid adenylation domain-containing protein [Colletotrichum scovillei]
MAPPRSLHSLEQLSLADRVLFNQFSRGPSDVIPYQVVHHAFESIAAAHPDATAVRHYDGTTITYRELNRRANVLANELRGTYGLRKGDRVVLVYSRCIEMVVFIFAVLKAGGQYVPLDGGIIPEDTLGYDIVDSNAPVVLCLPKFREKVLRSVPSERRDRVRVVDLDANSWLWTHGNNGHPGVIVKPEDGAYVIYTSGTTGRPKGVDVRHEGVTNTLLAEPSKLGIRVGKNVAQQLNVGFDMCAWEILGTMMNGGTLHIRGSGNDLWTDCLQRVDTVIATPSVVLKHMPRREDFPNIRTIAVGGEPCPLALAEQWAPYVKFWNVCGPTEISILNTAHLHKPGKTLSIGKPNPNTNVYVLDEDENPVKIGEPGIMWAGGPGVSRGYLNLPELTAQRYKVDKFAKDGRMMFNTGDLARWLEDGSLEPLGRKDDQVKISGFRVELDGVSRAIEKCPGVVKGCALKIDDRLWGFYSAPAPIDEAQLKTVVGEGQPFYAVPTVWKYLTLIELTPNGKVDKRALRDIAAGGAAQAPPPLPLADIPTGMSTPQQSSSASSVKTAVSPTSEGGFTLVDSRTFTVVDSQQRDIDLEKTAAFVEEAAEKEEEDYELPSKKGFHGWRWIRHRGLNAYRKLFGVIFLSNLAVFVWMLYESRNSNFSLPLNHLATAVAANLLGAVLLRQEYVVNFIFWACSRVPTSMPLSIRRHFARVYHNGGVHSGCAVSATVWWVIFTGAATGNFIAPQSLYSVNLITLVLTYLILILLVMILVMAYPSIRAKMHDQFEWTHRFAGWSALALVWAHVIATAASMSAEPLGPALAKTPALYLVALTSFSIALPWMRLRRVKVVPEPLSKHAVRLHFDFCTPGPCTSRGVRITDRPMVEWHAFAAIPEPSGKGFSIVVSKAGDWTKRIIENPPTSIWTRGTPASGVLAVAPLFKKMVLVATGSGIGPCLPVLMERRVPARVVWSTKNPLKTYGQGVMDLILKADPDALIWDTDERGRPDLVQLAYNVYKESGAECVAIISNGPTVNKFVYRMEARGIPAFGPIWDS